MNLQPHQQRVVTEKAELDDKLQKLNAFIQSPNFVHVDVTEQGRLRSQADAMARYAQILGQRIEWFQRESETGQH